MSTLFIWVKFTNIFEPGSYVAFVWLWWWRWMANIFQDFDVFDLFSNVIMYSLPKKVICAVHLVVLGCISSSSHLSILGCYLIFIFQKHHILFFSKTILDIFTPIFYPNFFQTRDRLKTQILLSGKSVLFNISFSY